MIEQGVIVLYIIANTVGLINSVVTYGFRIGLIGWYLAVITPYILAYKFYKRTRYIRKSIKYRISINENRLDVFITVLTVSTLLFSVATGYGTAETVESTSGQLVFSFLNINSVIYIYYAIGRRKKNRLYWINIVLYITLRIVQGYTGVILYFAIFELYYLLKNKIWYEELTINKIFFIAIGEIGAFIGGGIIYSFLRPLKYLIRSGTEGGLNMLSIFEGITYLTERLSVYPSTVRAFMVYDKIVSFYKKSVSFAEIQSILRPVVPRMLMPNKEFYNMGSCIAAVTSGIYNLGVSYSVGILMHAKLIFDSDVLTFVIWFCLYVISFLFIRKVISLIEGTEDEFNIIYFVICISFITNGNVETLFMQSYFKLIFFFPVLWALGVIKVEKYLNARY